MAHDFTSPSNARGKGPRDAYLEAFLDHAKLRLARGKYGRMHEHDRDDIAGRMILRVLPKVDDYRRRYPQPEKLASVMVNQAVIGYLRNDGAQKGLGARLTRKVDALDSLTIDPTASWDHDTVGEADTVAEATDTATMLDAALLGQGVSERDRELLWMVDGYGLKVREAADRMGIRRETANRILTKVREAAKAEVAQWKADGMSYPHRDA